MSRRRQGPVRRCTPASVCRLLLAAALFTSAAWAEGQAKLTLNFKDTDIHALITAVSEITGKNFVVDPRVKGNVTVISSSPTDADTLYQVFLSILKVHGYNAVPSGNIVKILPDAVARQSGGAAVMSWPDSAAEELVTFVIKLKHVAAPQLLGVLKPLIPQHGQVGAHPESNTLILTDSAANIERMVKIVRRIDRSTDRRIEAIPLQHANAADLTRVLTTLNRNAAGGGLPTLPLLAADERTNSILLSGDPDLRLEMRTLISHLDTPVGTVSNTEVVYLRYADAEDLAPILQTIGARQDESSRTAAGAEDTRTTFDVMADPPNNALVMMGEPERLKDMKSIIRQLDVRRAQVLVEGIVAEVSETKAAELGIQWRTNVPSDGVFTGTRFQFNNTESVNEFDPLVIGSGLSVGIFSGGSIRALLRALAGDNYTNVLATPNLMTLDNEEAEIVVGQNVPFITGSFTGEATTPENPFQTIERQDVGTILRVRPQINEGDSVKLTIEQEVSRVDQEAAEGSDLITSKRSIRTTVLVDDGMTIVLGGLISDDFRENIQKVPLLGDIPVLGALFRNSRTDHVKQNLMVFLRPRIVRDARTGSNLTNSKYDFIRSLQQRGQKSTPSLKPSFSILPPMAPTTMPPIEKSIEQPDQAPSEEPAPEPEFSPVWSSRDGQ